MPEKPAENERLLWPALVILKTGRGSRSSAQLIRMFRESLQVLRLLEDEDSFPKRLKSPAPFQDVVNWLNTAWHLLSAAQTSEVLFRRQALTSEIVRSGLPANEQTNLITAVDYLSRLAAARKVAERTRDPAPTIRSTGNPRMQAAYRKLISLAATDLPIWLVGEKGTELESLARLVHRLRGLPEGTFRVWEHSVSRRPDDSGAWRDFDDLIHDRYESTVFALAMDEASEATQRSLYRHLINDLGGSLACRTIVASMPVEYDDSDNSTLEELSAFLGPSRVDIPPLRSRIEDLPALIRFFASSRGLKDPTGRLQREAVEELRAYHWPGNVEELEMVTAFLLRMRPSGPIRREDLPETVRRPFGPDRDTLQVLDEIAVESKFRVLKTEEGRHRLAIFLSERKGEDFRAGDIPILFGMGRETARRLLLSLESKGLIAAVKGAKERRTTHYRISNKE